MDAVEERFLKAEGEGPALVEAFRGDLKDHDHLARGGCNLRSGMNTRGHWEQVYTSKASDSVSWFRPHLETSIAMIERLGSDRSCSIIDVGGGESTLVDDLIAHGFRNLAVLDVSKTALEVTKKRLGELAEKVHWMETDITAADLSQHSYDLWHDRAAFHFLTDQEQRKVYVAKAALAIKPRGYILLSTFGPEGPTHCSGLKVMRYDVHVLQNELGPSFQLIENLIDWHITPTGGKQQFLHCAFQKV